MDDQVVAKVGYCKGEYTLTMANGAQQRYPEFNLRFKTDSSGNAPCLEERMNVERSRITLLTGGAAFALALTTGIWSLARSEPLPGVTVYKSPT